MWISRLVVCLLFAALAATDCTNTADQQAGPHNNDSAEEDVRDYFFYESCYENFFKTLPKFKDSVSAWLLLKNRKKVTLTQFFTDEFMSPVSQYGTKDLNGDGILELVVYNNTGGAHCCDEYYIFKQKDNKNFEYTANLVSGQICIDSTTNIFTYSFNETLGYFFGCYACGFQDSSGIFKSMREIKLKYNNHKFEIVPYDTNAEQQNLANLEVLHHNGYEEVEGLMDNGWRKELAMNFAVWHYNHRQDWKKTKNLFDKYYNFEDSIKVWTEFYSTLKEMTKENSF